ncbi:MAG: hypothetical protein R2865_03030 [Deinococcales bacterium]
MSSLAARKVVSQLKSALSGVDSLFIATDEDCEGEANWLAFARGLKTQSAR